MEKSFVMLKPGVLNRRIVGEIISRLEKKGFKLVAMKLMLISQEKAEDHYKEHKGKAFYDSLIRYTISGPVIAMIWQGDNCISLIRKIVGSTVVTEAQAGTIRGDYCLHTPYNIIHASDSIESSVREIELFFSAEEIISWNDELAQWF